MLFNKQLLSEPSALFAHQPVVFLSNFKSNSKQKKIFQNSNMVGISRYPAISDRSDFTLQSEFYASCLAFLKFSLDIFKIARSFMMFR